MCPEDRRGVAVCLTDEGRERYEAARPTHRRVLAEISSTASSSLVPAARSAARRRRRWCAASLMSSAVRRTTITRCDAASSVKPRPAIAQATCQASRPVSRRSIARRTLSLSLLTSGPRTRTPSISAIRSRAIDGGYAETFKARLRGEVRARSPGAQMSGRGGRGRPWRNPPRWSGRGPSVVGVNLLPPGVNGLIPASETPAFIDSGWLTVPPPTCPDCGRPLPADGGPCSFCTLTAMEARPPPAGDRAGHGRRPLPAPAPARPRRGQGRLARARPDARPRCRARPRIRPGRLGAAAPRGAADRAARRPPPHRHGP